MTTRRLYWDDALQLTFEGRVIAADAAKGTVELDATAFCPEAGGQPPDAGRLEWEGGGARVKDVQEVGERLLHLVETSAPGALPAPGQLVRGTIDEGRRRDHMSQHTGQHMLSRALLDVAQAPTSAIRLGEAICTVDLSVPKLGDEAVADAEALVARVVLEDRPVRILRPTAEELAKLPLRRELKVSHDVRVIEIEGFDYSPCGGTHCQRTGQVGFLKVVAAERYKGGIRLSFHAGQRALSDYSLKDRVVSGLAREFSTSLEGLPLAVQKLRGELQEQSRAAAALREQLAGHVAAELLAKAPRDAAGVRWVIAELKGQSIEYARAVAGRAAADGAIAVIAATSPEDVRIVIERGAAVTGFDAGASLKKLAAASGGRGGGRPDRAEGQLPAGVDLRSLCAREIGAP